ncbi:MAG TPA: hypothetical protein VGC06_15140 [Actinomycetes bacterium]
MRSSAGLAGWPVASGEDFADAPSQGRQGCRVGAAGGVGGRQFLESLLAGIEQVPVRWSFSRGAVDIHGAVFERGQVLRAVRRLTTNIHLFIVNDL